MSFLEQNHLSKQERINLGSYYTKPQLVNLVYKLLNNNVQNINKYTILDSSCGYGSFLSNEGIVRNRKIGADIDSVAVENARENINNIETVVHNSLISLSRKQYGLANDEKLIIVGNPPYNDVTSIIRNEIKNKVKHDIHPDLRTRDLGMSFLRSYAKLDPDFVCVLHPLSYLIKKANFDSLGDFAHKYNLVDSVVVSSAEFNGTAPGKTYFPIIIALYAKDDEGMVYQNIEKFVFTTKEGPKFSLSDMNSIRNYLSKYPNQKWVKPSEAVAKFWTMRDINALKRSKTFVDDINENTILVTPNKLAYYCYVDVFKKFIEYVPYYFGNCDVFIDNEHFSKIKDHFIALSAKSHPELNTFTKKNIENPEGYVKSYFKSLLKEHYVGIK